MIPSGPGRLSARVGAAAGSLPSGLHELAVTSIRDALVVVPDGLTVEEPAPLLVVLHGAGGDAQQSLALLGARAGAQRVILVAVSSRGPTWDLLLGGPGPDVECIDEALARAFRLLPVDPAAVAVGGFSDGASAALALGLANGDLFSAIVAFSPGFVPSGLPRVGAPRAFVSHGTGDRVLPIDRCSRRIVASLHATGTDVEALEFDGGHTVPAEVVERAMRWLLPPPG